MEPANTDVPALVRRWVEAINNRDLTALLNLSHPDIECQPLELRSRAAYTGRTGLTEWILELIVAVPGVRVRIQRVQTLSAERAAVFGTVHVNGDDVSPYVLVAVVRDGKVAAMRSCLGDESAMEQLGLVQDAWRAPSLA
jgi:ketosteroid isomerase-like protein